MRDLSQNVSGSGSKPSEVKKPSPISTISFWFSPFSLSKEVMFTPFPELLGATKSYILPQL